MQSVSSRIVGLFLTLLRAGGASLAKREGPAPGDRG
jgi:hypothetical protein